VVGTLELLKPESRSESQLLVVREAWAVDFCLGHFVESGVQRIKSQLHSKQAEARSHEGDEAEVIAHGHKEEGPSRGASARHSELPEAQERECVWGNQACIGNQRGPV
jgi:hypothetical protein